MKLTTREMTYIAITPALMAATAWVAIPLSIGAPITLQTLFVMICALLFTSKISTQSMIVYVLLGMIGIPIFAGFTGGFGVIVGPTGGFIVGFIIMAFFISKMKNVKIINNEKIDIIIILVIANIILYMIGGTYMAFVLGTDIPRTIAILTPYIPGDILKIIVSLYAYLNIRSYVTYEGSQI